MGKVVEGKLTELDIQLLYEAAKVAHQSTMEGNHPFGALLADKEGRILIRAGNDHRQSPALHAETKVMLEAGERFSSDFLATCTLYTTAEPCVMCTGALYWTNVRRLVYGISEEQLLNLTGSSDENPTFSLDCRSVIEAGQKDIIVIGPVEDTLLRETILADHRGFWK
ncbi:MAG: nucleoside deaminase [Sphaerochaetaceae bacterium]